MKLLGLSFGRKMENTEVLVKEALMAAEKAGAEVGMIRVTDLDIKPCSGCTSCARSLIEGGAGKCIIKDDLHFVDEHLMQSDGIILGSPVFVLTPTGLLKDVCDRFGPSHDLAWRMEATKIREAKGKSVDKGPDQRAFKPRVAGFISVGGAATAHWLSMGLPLMNLFTFSSDISVVDQMQVMAVTRYGHVVMHDQALERARKLGRNVAAFMGKQKNEVQWLGDEPGTCPVCHSNLLTVGSKNPVECPICGIKGTLKMEGDRITVTFTEEEKKNSRLGLPQKAEHFFEVGQNYGMFMQRTDKDEIPKRLAKYEGYKELKLS
jgi:multimeric flavodoxin WrbA